MAHSTKTSSGSDGVLPEVPSEIVDGVNKVFSCSSIPAMVIADHLMYREGMGYTYTNGQVTMTDAPKKDIFIIY